MQQTANAKQFNNFIRLPLELFNAPRLPLGTVLFFGAVQSFTGTAKNGAALTYRRTYDGIKNELGISRASVGRAVRTGKDIELVSHDRKNGYVFSSDKLTGDTFLRLPDWVQSEEFSIRKKKRRLKLSERVIYAYLFTQCDNKKRYAKYIEISYSELAKILDLTEKTVRRAVWALIRAGLIYRPKADKGVNAYKKSRYTLNYKLVRKHERTTKEKKTTPAPSSEPKHQEQNASTLPAEELKAEIEKIYYDKRYRAEQLADSNRERAERYEKYKTANDAAKSLAIGLAFAELREPGRVPELNRRIAAASRERLVALRELGLTEQDLSPQYECKSCEDTGYKLSDGSACECMQRLITELRGSPPGNGAVIVGEGEQNIKN